MKATLNTLNTSQALYMIVFHGVTQKFIFNDTPGVLGDLIQQHGQHGIVEVRRFNSAKASFGRLAKSELKSFFDWDTHSIEQLKAKNFIK